MRSVNEHGRPTDGSSFRELRLLEEVDTRAEVSQRHLAHQLGVALGVANLLIRRLATKGYIRVTQVGWKRWVYVLTPAGVARKVQLTLAYVDRVLDHYQRVRSSLREGLASETLNTESRVAIYGSSELAELVYLALRDLGVTEIEVFDRNGARPRFLGMPVRDLESMVGAHYSQVIVAMPAESDARCAELVSAGVPASKIVTLSPGSIRVGDGAKEEETLW